MNKLNQLKKYTTIVADTGDFESISIYKPTDSTTNPSLILKATTNPSYQPLIEDAIVFSKKSSLDKQTQLENALDKLLVNFGKEILKVVPGRVSIEVDARLSFDTEGTVKKAKKIIDLFKQENIDTSKILIKIAATWEGIQAAKQLEKEGISCNITLLFSLVQAAAAAEANATLISPFVGRILDWYAKNNLIQSKEPKDDPGVISVKNIYNYLKNHDYKTQIMGASFRNIEEILELSGLDLLTISPNLLEQLNKQIGQIEPKLKRENAKKENLTKIKIDEKTFRLMLNENQMATEKLSDGIRLFIKDIIKLEEKILAQL